MEGVNPMSGHSKWHNIQAKKSKTDAQKAKIFTKMSREIILAVRDGGPNPDSNAKLASLIAKAKANNVPNDNLKRVIERASGSADGANYESITYEGHGPSGVAVIVEAMTDNRNRTASEVRHAFDKFGGSLGVTGCVSWSFDQKGVLVIERGDLDEDKVMMDAIESGADEFEATDETFEITTAPDDFDSVLAALEKLGYNFIEAEVEMVPQTYVTLGEEDKVKMQKMLDLLEDSDDVQEVWHNWDEEE